MSYLTILFDQMSYLAKCRIDQKSYAASCRIGEMVFDELSCTLVYLISRVTGVIEFVKGDYKPWFQFTIKFPVCYIDQFESISGDTNVSFVL